MKKLVMYGLVAATLFALSTTISLYYLHSKPTTAKTGESTTAKTGETSAKPGESESAEKLRPLVKAITPDTEQTAMLLQTLREREKAVKEKEEQTGQRRKQMELVYQDIRGERSILDDLRKQTSDELREVGKRIAEAEKKSGDLDKQKQNVAKDVTDLQKRQFEIEVTERKNIDKLAKVYESMAPESAARIIQQMCDSGRMDTAVKVLSPMRERQAAEILSQFSDPGLAGQLTEKLRGIKRLSLPSGVSAGVSSVIAPPVP